MSALPSSTSSSFDDDDALALPEPEYDDRQKRMDAEYVAAWNAMPSEQRAAVEQACFAALPATEKARRMRKGEQACGADTGREEAKTTGREVVGREDDVEEAYRDSRRLATERDVAAEVDGLSDLLTEEFGLSARQAMGVAEFIEARVRTATMETHSLLLARIVGFFLAGSDNLQARAHGLAHAARMASLNGLRSLRHSAEACGVSPEWIRRVAWKWCELLELPPLEGAKSAAACANYSEVQKNKHWRKQTCQPHQPLVPPAPTLKTKRTTAAKAAA